MPFETLAEIDQHLPGVTQTYYKSAGSNGLGYTTLWNIAGIPAAGTYAASLGGALCDRTTAGALILPRLPATANASHLARIDFSHGAQAAGTYSLADRLWHNTIGNATGTQNINSATFGRYNGEDVQLWLCISVATSSTTSNLTVTYTNDAGTTGRVGVTSFANILGANRAYPLNLQAGDTGVRSVQSVAWSTAYTLGTMHLVARKPIALVEARALRAESQRIDVIRLGMPSIQDNACLEFSGYWPIGTSAYNVMMELSFLQE